MDDLRRGKLLDRYLYAVAASLAVLVPACAFSEARWPLYAWAVFALPLCLLAVVQSTRFMAELTILAFAALFRWIVRRLWKTFRIGPEPFRPTLPSRRPPAPPDSTQHGKPRRVQHNHPVL